LGELAVFRNQPRSATIRARGQLRVVKIDADIFLRIVSESPDVALNIMRILSDKLAKMTESFERFESGHRQLTTSSETC
jgi:CRP-like cAMP-binding protein